MSLEKSNIQPQQVFEYLGMVWDTRDRTVRLVEKKQKLLLREVKRWAGWARSGRQVTARELASFVGGLSATRAQHTCASLYLATAYRLLAHTTQTVGWNATLHLTPDLLPYLAWWRETLTTNKPERFSPFVPLLTLVTDAGGSGWGATLTRERKRTQPQQQQQQQQVKLQTRMAFGWWQRWELTKMKGTVMKEVSSNERELMAVEKTVSNGLDMGWIRKGMDVLVRTDNTTTFFNINRKASCLNLRPTMRRLLRMTEQEDVRLRAEHVPGVENVVADSLSRLSPSGDYGLKPGVLDGVLRQLGVAIEVDWFANKRNKQHQRYCSLSKDPHALAQDALAQNWSRMLGLLHPPLPLLPRCLAKVREEKATAVVILPTWRGMLWSSTLQAMTVKKMVIGWSEEVLVMGPRMRKNGSKLPPGKIQAVLVQG